MMTHERKIRSWFPRAAAALAGAALGLGVAAWAADSPAPAPIAGETPHFWYRV